MRRQKAREKHWIQQLCILGRLCVHRIECDDGQENPDAFLLLRNEQRIVKAGVEATEYHSDASSGKGSPARELHSNWLKIEGLLLSLAQNHPELRGVLVTVRLKRPAHLPAGREAKALAKNLVALAASIVPHGTWKNVGTRAPFPRSHESVGGYVREIALACIGLPDWLHWDYSPKAGSFGLEPERVRAIVRQKEGATYDWADAHERWLLIVSGSQPGLVKSWGEPRSWCVRAMPQLRRCIFDRVLLLEATFGYVSELYRAPALPALPSE